jgi:hypothetical protein
VFLQTHTRFSLSFSIGILINPFPLPAKKEKNKTKERKILEVGFRHISLVKTKEDNLM